jgi:hypothetical protein
MNERQTRFVSCRTGSEIQDWFKALMGLVVGKRSPAQSQDQPEFREVAKQYCKARSASMASCVSNKHHLESKLAGRRFKKV